MINVKAYAPMRFGKGKWRLQTRERSERHVWLCTRLCDCKRWSDLYRVAKWHFARVVDACTGRCWARLCSWAWDDWHDQSWSGTCGEDCKREADAGMTCWCGKYQKGCT